MWTKLEEVEQRFEIIGQQLSSQEVVADVQQLRKLSKEHKDLSKIVAAFRMFKKVK